MVSVFLLLTIKKDALTREIFSTLKEKLFCRLAVMQFISPPNNYKTGLPVQRSVGQLQSLKLGSRR